MKRNLGYAAIAAAALALAIVLVTGGGGDDEPPRTDVEAREAIVGVYRIASVRIDDREQPALVGRELVVVRDGPDLVGGLCPDPATCRRWLDDTPAFRHAVASLAATTTIAGIDPETLLSSAHILGASAASTTTMATGHCRRRVDEGSFTPNEVGLRVHRELAQTELGPDCESKPTSDRVTIDLDLVRLSLDES